MIRPDYPHFGGWSRITKIHMGYKSFLVDCRISSDVAYFKTFVAFVSSAFIKNRRMAGDHFLVLARLAVQLVDALACQALALGPKKIRSEDTAGG
jgi:hypothetical protein